MVAKVVGICIDYDQKKWSEDKNAISRTKRRKMDEKVFFTTFLIKIRKIQNEDKNAHF